MPRSIRKLPSKPVASSVSPRRNGILMAAAAKLWIKPTDVVLDPTWGRGRFWTDYKHPGRLIRHDLKLDGVDFRQLPEDDASIDVAVFDPPYTSPGGRETSTLPEFHDRYGTLETPKGADNLREELIGPGIKECARVLKPGGILMVKCANFIESGTYQMGHYFVVDTALDCGLNQIDEFVAFLGAGAQPKKNLDGTVRRQVHSRRSHSFLCIFRVHA